MSLGRAIFLIAPLTLQLIVYAETDQHPNTNNESQATKTNPKIFIGEEFLNVSALTPQFGPDRIARKKLFSTETQSFHIVWIKDGEKPHIHKKHDLTVFLVSGEGTFYIGNKKFSMKAGDSAFVPKGTPHHFVNEADLSIALVIFTPPFDGEDNIPVGEK